MPSSKNRISTCSSTSTGSTHSLSSNDSSGTGTTISMSSNSMTNTSRPSTSAGQKEDAGNRQRVMSIRSVDSALEMMSDLSFGEDMRNWQNEGPQTMENLRRRSLREYRFPLAAVDRRKHQHEYTVDDMVKVMRTNPVIFDYVQRCLGSLPEPPLPESASAPLSRPMGIAADKEQLPEPTLHPPEPQSTVPPAKIWNSELLPWFLDNFDLVLGKFNTGSIELLHPSGRRPLICITAGNPDLVSRALVRSRLAAVRHIDFGLEVLSGEVCRTGVGRGNPQNRTLWPPARATYSATPTCGSSIGIVGTDDAASFGGFLELKFVRGQRVSWELFGLTCHHLLETRGPDTPARTGVQDDGREFEVCQPASIHSANEHYGLRRYMAILKARHDLHTDEEMRRMDPIERSRREDEILRVSQELWYHALRSEHGDHRFGNVTFSSGFGFTPSRDRRQMDWALIGRLPAARCKAGNCFPGGSVQPGLNFFQPGTIVAQVAGEDLFDAVADIYEAPDQLAVRDQSPPEPILRVHGCGAATGPQSGYLSATESAVRLGPHDQPSREWSFAPYHSLGDPGDSGSWIVNDFGAVVGMIVGRNRKTNLTYFTPMHEVIEDIKTVTGAAEVRLPLWEREGNRDSGIDMVSLRSMPLSVSSSSAGSKSASETSSIISREIAGRTGSIAGGGGLGWLWKRARGI